MVEVFWERTDPTGACPCRRLEVIRDGVLVKLELQTCAVCIKIALSFLKGYLTEREQFDMFHESQDTSRSYGDEEGDPGDLFSNDRDPRGHCSPPIT